MLCQSTSLYVIRADAWCVIALTSQASTMRTDFKIIFIRWGRLNLNLFCISVGPLSNRPCQGFWQHDKIIFPSEIECGQSHLKSHNTLVETWAINQKHRGFDMLGKPILQKQCSWVYELPTRSFPLLHHSQCHQSFSGWSLLNLLPRCTPHSILSL